jgi:hypothetical protein
MSNIVGLDLGLSVGGLMAQHVPCDVWRLSRLLFLVRRWMCCTRLRYQHRQMAQPFVSPFHGRLCLRVFARAAVAESFISPEVGALMSAEVSVEIVAAFLGGHAL